MDVFEKVLQTPDSKEEALVSIFGALLSILEKDSDLIREPTVSALSSVFQRRDLGDEESLIEFAQLLVRMGLELPRFRSRLLDLIHQALTSENLDRSGYELSLTVLRTFAKYQSEMIGEDTLRVLEAAFSRPNIEEENLDSIARVMIYMAVEESELRGRVMDSIERMLRDPKMSPKAYLTLFVVILGSSISEMM